MYCAADYILIPGGQDTKKMSEMADERTRDERGRFIREKRQPKTQSGRARRAT